MTQLILYTFISLDVFPEFLNHILIYLYYKGILDKLPYNLSECIICFGKTKLEGQFKVLLIFVIFSSTVYSRPYVWHRFLFIRFNIMITCIFTCTFKENQLKIMDNTCNKYTSILFEPLRSEFFYSKIIPFKCHEHLNLKYIMNSYQEHVINFLIETDF